MTAARRLHKGKQTRFFSSSEEVPVSAKQKIQVFLQNLYDEKAVEVARRMPFLKKEFKVGVTFVDQDESGDGIFADSGIDLTPVDLPPLPPDDHYYTVTALADSFKGNIPDVALAALPNPQGASFLIAAKAQGVQLVIAEVDDEPSLLSGFEELTSLYFSDLILPATRNLQRILTNMLPQLSKRVGNLLPHSADTTYIQLTKEDRRRRRQQLHVNTEQKMITMIAPFDRRRDYDTLIEACALLKQRGHHFTLLLVGDGPERPRIAERVYALRLEDQVTIMDDPGDHLDILCATDIFALCTHFEGNSIPLIEAMAQGLAIAGTDVPGINDLIRDERSGRLAKPKDPESFAQALIDLLAQEKIRKKLGSVARKCIENRGNLNQFMPAFINTVKKRLKEPSSSARKAAAGAGSELAKKYLNLQEKVRSLWEQPDLDPGISEAANLMDGFPINVQVDILEKLCSTPIESAPLAVFVRPLEKVLSDRFFENLPILESRLLEKLAAFYIELGYAEGAEKVIEKLEGIVSGELFRYQSARDRFTGIRAHVRLAQLHEFVGDQDKRDFYRLELWEHLRAENENKTPYFHQQNAACLENLGEVKLALREIQRDVIGAVRLHPDIPVATGVPEKPLPVIKTALRSVALRDVKELEPETAPEGLEKTD